MDAVWGRDTLNWDAISVVELISFVRLDIAASLSSGDWSLGVWSPDYFKRNYRRRKSVVTRSWGVEFGMSPNSITTGSWSEKWETHYFCRWQRTVTFWTFLDVQLTSYSFMCRPQRGILLFSGSRLNLSCWSCFNICRILWLHDQVLGINSEWPIKRWCHQT